MNHYYAPPDSIAGDTIVFPDDEAHHAIRVMRVRTGEEAAVVDGHGTWYRVELEVVGRKGLIGRILETREEAGEPRYDLTLAVGLLKNGSRYEHMLEKVVELGVRRVIPLVSNRTERSRIKESRVRTILTSAMKQCGRSRLVSLEDPVRFKKWLKRLDVQAFSLLALCHEEIAPDDSLSNRLRSRGVPARSLVLVGPEGGFTTAEIAQATDLGFEIVSLGPRRLRTETAAMTVATLFMSEAVHASL